MALAIWPATVLAVDEGATGMGAPITEMPPTVMSMIVPPAALTLVTPILPSFCSAEHSAGVVVQLIVCVRPRCLAWMKAPVFLRWHLLSVVGSLHQRTPEKVCAAVRLLPAAQLVSSASVQNSGASTVWVLGLIDEPLAQLVSAGGAQYCAVCMR